MLISSHSSYLSLLVFLICSHLLTLLSVYLIYVLGGKIEVVNRSDFYSGRVQQESNIIY